MYESRVPPMISRFAWLVLVLFAAGSSACNRARALGPPKAVPVVADGKLVLVVLLGLGVDVLLLLLVMVNII